MSVMQSNLPYARDALEPHLSAATVALGYERRHRIAVDTLNARICDTPYASLSLENVIERARAREDCAVIEDASEVWNYGFQWQSLSPEGGGKPSGALARLITGHFGGIADFRTRFVEEARQNCGRGWLWLAWSPEGLALFSAPDGVTLARTEWTPLAVLNLSEHAYTLDFRSNPGGYAEAFLDHLISWEFADTMLRDALYQKAA